MNLKQVALQWSLVYVWMALASVAVKVLTPFWNDASWSEVLVVIPLGGSIVWSLSEFLVRTIQARLNQRR
ncbi:MAG: hypothetical protein D6802_10850 [Ardenticatenia bacterium]|nr:MAG: hypothetical protein D6802_10850 [Ardenticatenia bacterium]